jgi:hypothetical protein
LDFRTGHRIGKLSEEQRQEVTSQLNSYFENSSLGMTKQGYFEMCEMMNTDPVESQIPVEYEDLVLEVQQALQIYHNLQDSWDYMGGNYIGKNLSGFRDVLDILEIPQEDRRSIYELVMMIDRIRANIINTKNKAEKPH